jgi:ABC-type glycerol-3-phosphate transport system substrate-binding protein
VRRLVIWMLVGTMLLAACGPAAEETPPPSPIAEAAPSPVLTAVPTEPAVQTEQVTVRFALSDWNLPLYEGFIEAFEEDNPEIRIEVVSANEVLELGPIGQLDVPDDADQRLVAAADVVEIGVGRETVRDGLVRDLSPYLDADAKFQPDDYYLDALQVYQWDGGTWALPSLLNLRLMFFDKDAFDAAGVAYPEEGWSWDDLLVKAKALTEREGDNVTRWGFVPGDLAYRLIESRAGQLADYEADPPAPRFDDPDVVEAVRWYTDLYLRDQVMPYFEPPEVGDEPLISDAAALIDSGQAAMWPDTDVLWWVRTQQGNIGVVPFPADAPDWPANPGTVGSLAMSAGTTQPEASWRWLEYLSRQSITGMQLGIRLMSARRSAAETGGFWDGLDEEFEGALRYAIDHGYAARAPVAYEAFSDALDAILSGEQSVEDALAAAQAQAEADIAQALAEESGATPAPTFVVEPAGEETPISGDVVRVTFSPALGSFNLEPYRDLAERFHEEHPGTLVDVKMANFVTGTPGLPEMAEASDCFEWFPGFQDPANREAILNLEPFADADPSFDSGDFFPQALQLFTYQGQLWGLPSDITPFVVEFNKDLFDAEGLDYPENDWTWDDFLATTVALTRGDGDTKQYGFVAEYYELNDLLLITERLGAVLVDDSVDPPAFAYDDPATVEAMQWYADLTTVHGVKPIFVTDLNTLLGATSAVMEREGLVNEGRAAIWTGSPAGAALFGDRSELNAGAASLPLREDGTSTASFLATSGYFISADTDNREACWQWITFLSDHPEANQGLPARRSVAESDEYKRLVGADKAEAYLASVGDSDRPSAFQIFSEEDWLGWGIFWYGQAFGQVLEGDVTVEEALDAAQKLADDYRACVIAGDDFGDSAAQACAKQVDPTLPDFLFPASD